MPDGDLTDEERDELEAAMQTAYRLLKKKYGDPHGDEP